VLQGLAACSSREAFRVNHCTNRGKHSVLIIAQMAGRSHCSETVGERRGNDSKRYNYVASVPGMRP
jgi:hypothetical protein